MVVLVTDGQVGNEDHLMRQLGPICATRGCSRSASIRRSTRRSCAGSPSAGGGLCELVESEDRLDAVMAKVHRRIGTPIVTELALQTPGVDLTRGELAPMTAPGKLPDVYAGAPVVIFGRYRGAAPTSIDARWHDARRAFHATVRSHDHDRAATSPRAGHVHAFAISRIGTRPVRASSRPRS